MTGTGTADRSESNSGVARPRMHLGDLSRGFPAVTPRFGEACAEAAAVCLEVNGRRPGVDLFVSGCFARIFELDWPEVSEEARRCWNDLQEATEHGAYGLAFLLVRSLTDYTVIERSRKGTGFDYWLGFKDDLFQKKARLEVSGILKGTDARVEARVREKSAQTRPTDSLGLPAYIVVIEFHRPRARVVEK